MPRKTPVLLRPGPMSGEIYALTRYSRKNVRGSDIISAATDGKHTVTADFDAIVCELLLNDAPNVCEALDGAALGMELNDDEKNQIRAFRTALVKIIERHNARLA